MVLVESKQEPLLDTFDLYQPPQTPKWMGKAET